MPLFYHKIDSLHWIDGSIRWDLMPDERSVWADLLAMAGLTREPRRGYIEVSEGIGYPGQALLVRLNITKDLFDRTIVKCVAEGRLQIFPDGKNNTIYLITNWNKYNDTKTLVEHKRIQSKGIQNSKQRKVSKNVITESATRAVNEANKALSEAKTLTQLVEGKLGVANVDGMLVDATTGEIMAKEGEK